VGDCSNRCLGPRALNQTIRAHLSLEDSRGSKGGGKKGGKKRGGVLDAMYGAKKKKQFPIFAEARRKTTVHSLWAGIFVERRQTKRGLEGRGRGVF